MGYENSEHTFVRLTWPDNAESGVVEDVGTQVHVFFDRAVLNLSSDDYEKQFEFAGIRYYYR